MYLMHLVVTEGILYPVLIKQGPLHIKVNEQVYHLPILLVKITLCGDLNRSNIEQRGLG